MKPYGATRTSMIFVWFIAMLATASSLAEPMLKGKKWNHGSANCLTDSEPPIEVYSHSPTSFILRQSKCLSFEAPFMYLLVGEKLALLLDTGATKDASVFPLYKTVRSLIGEKDLLIVHSHGHQDHRSADIQFQGETGVRLVGIQKTALIQSLSISQWPGGQGSIELGNRELIVIPSPGHHEVAISLYDPQTQWLLTGDKIYPGLIYVKNWKDYRDSIARLTRFAEEHDVSAVLGAHIEATDRPGEYYAVGTIYQPAEAPLPMDSDILAVINAQLQQSPKANQIALSRLKIIPMNLMQRKLSDFGRWLSR
ncbi:MBL fold metallo-hydrolase [Congregibacter variabilis]|uniref:MBL fold metallo-hydrolase n=1 Tax=Congregibacter variabilis TaxID=3081200 RepID=A0ABZ0I1J9_9GAMM|nr:MBL fold metallo-hydrolase [Congregibacter sp. IMCC43200]